jgi:hypothetical protein
MQLPKSLGCLKRIRLNLKKSTAFFSRNLDRDILYTLRFYGPEAARRPRYHLEVLMQVFYLVKMADVFKYRSGKDGG